MAVVAELNATCGWPEVNITTSSIFRWNQLVAGGSSRYFVSRHWQRVLVPSRGSTVSLDDLCKLSELWMGCAAE
jgi:hypothetical protein